MNKITTTAYVRDKYGRNASNEVILHNDHALDDIARLAGILVEKWGMVACSTTSEDSSGRAKLDLMSVEEVVTRSFDMAERFYDEAFRRQHVIAVPNPFADDAAE